MKKLYGFEKIEADLNPFLQHYVTKAVDKASLNSPRSNPVSVKCVSKQMSV
jgi:hypothetical protein